MSCNISAGTSCQYGHWWTVLTKECWIVDIVETVSRSPEIKHYLGQRYIRDPRTYGAEQSSAEVATLQHQPVKLSENVGKL